MQAYACIATNAVGSSAPCAVPVTPGEPVIRVFDGHGAEQTLVEEADQAGQVRVGPLDEGSMVVVECSSSGGRPQPDVKWLNGTHVLRNKISVSANPDSSTNVTSTTKFIISRYDLGSVLTCSVSNNATRNPLTRRLAFDVRGRQCDRRALPCPAFATRGTQRILSLLTAPLLCSQATDAQDPWTRDAGRCRRNGFADVFGGGRTTRCIDRLVQSFRAGGSTTACSGGGGQ